MLDAIENSVHCMLSEHARTLNGIKDLADISENVMVRRNSIEACLTQSRFWG
jgi:hypothetical protein